MVVVQVGDQHGVDPLGDSRVGLGVLADDHRQQARAKHRVGEHANPVELDQGRRVADVCDPIGAQDAASAPE